MLTFTISAGLAAVAWGQAGTLDRSFATDGKGTTSFGLFGIDQASDIALAEDRSVILAGTAHFTSTDADFAILRLTPSGALDPTFGAGNGMTTVAFDIGSDLFDNGRFVAIAPDGKIVVAGNVQAAGANTFDIGITRLLTNGVRDADFDQDGRVVVPINFGGDNNDLVDGLAIQPDGKILLAGTSSTSAPNSDQDCVVVRLRVDGSLDPTFGSSGIQRFVFAPPGMESSDRCEDLQLQADGKIVLTARSTSPTSITTVARLTAAGTLDNTFGTGGVTQVDLGPNPEAIEALAIDAAGRIVITGLVPGLGWDVGVARLLPTGVLDTSFASGGTATFSFDLGDQDNDAPRAIAVQPDGRIVIVGVIDIGIDDTDFFALRLSSDGVLDTTFGIAGLAVVPFDLLPSRSDTAQAFVVRPDGRILLAGAAYSTELNASRFAYAQLHGAPPVFFDDFESGNLDAWSSTVP